MIRFTRKENKVIVQIEHGIFFDEEYFVLKIDQNENYQAELLSRQLNENLNNHLIKLKEKYYMEGWKNAKAKSAKRKFFFGGWE